MKQLRGNFVLFVLSLQLAFLSFFIRASIRNCFHSPATSFASIFEILFKGLTISPCTILARRFSVVQQTQRVGIDVILTPYPRSLSLRIMAEDVRSSCWIKFIFCFFVETTFVATSRSPGRASTSTATLNTSGSLLQSLLSILRVETSTSFTFTSTVFKLRCWLIE